MTPALRGPWDCPGGCAMAGSRFMATAAGKPIDVAKILTDPAVAEKVARIGVFHIEQNADKPPKSLMRAWGEGMQADLGNMLKDLGYEVEPESWKALLSKVWDQLRADEDIKGELGELPPFDATRGDARKPRTPRTKGRASRAPATMARAGRRRDEGERHRDRASRPSRPARAAPRGRRKCRRGCRRASGHDYLDAPAQRAREPLRAAGADAPGRRRTRAC